MPIINKKSIAIFLSAVLIFTVFALTTKTKPALAENTGSISISSSCSSCNIGGTVIITAKAVSTSNAIGGVEINLNYDKAKLKYESISYFSGSNDFTDILSEQINQNIGVIHVEAGKPGGLLHGEGNVFAAAFTVTTTGSASINFGPLDGANQDGRVFLSGNSLNITLTSVTPPIVDPPSNPPSNPSSTSSTRTTTSSASTTTTTTTTATTYNFSKSEIVFDKTTAIADGSDKICASIIVKNFGTIITDLKPTIKIEGGADLTNIDLNKNSWNFCTTSTTASAKRLMISVQSRLIKDQMVSFSSLATTATLEPAAEKIDDNQVAEPVENSRDLVLQQLSSVTGNVSIITKKDILNKSGFTDVDLIEISGTATPGLKLKLYIYPSVFIRKYVAAGDDGKWSTKISKPLTPGAYRVDAAVIDNYDQESDATLVANFTVAKSNNKTLIFSAIGGIIAIILVIILIIYRRRKLVNQGSEMSFEAPATQMDTTVTQTEQSPINNPDANTIGITETNYTPRETLAPMSPTPPTTAVETLPQGDTPPNSNDIASR
ncbi:MAG: cohesin domain-containing protein [Candidatus Berkelbacteria bacterium]